MKVPQTNYGLERVKMNNNEKYQYFDTFQLDNGEFIGHLFEKIDEGEGKQQFSTNMILFK